MEETSDSRSTLSIAIVHYRSNETRLAQTLHSCMNALYFAKDHGLITKTTLFFVENSRDEYAQKILAEIQPHWPGDIAILSPDKNLGFGAGHNLAIMQLPKETGHNSFHLILNPDVILQRDTIAEAVHFMLEHSTTACLSPFCTDEHGKKTYLCKRYPCVLTLAARAFFKDTKVQSLQRRMADYEMREITENEVVDSVPIASGCFMFWRTQVLQELKGFDANFFLYFEDFDLCLRLYKDWHISYAPQVRITHLGGNTFQKGIYHTYLFCESAIKFFQKHGWKWI
ncbi:MAG: glycosyltransferase [Dissulfuribacterales bacterium]